MRAWTKLAARWWWLLALLLAPLIWSTTSLVERACILVAILLICAALVKPKWRGPLSALSASLLLACLLSLALHLLSDDFHVHYVWLYSAATLPNYLKLANVWGGEEGTLLFLASLLAIAATRLSHYPGWAGPGALLLTVVFSVGVLIWDPFVATPAEDLSELPSRGMNAHLLSVWMALHPPLTFIAYAFVLAPVGAALEALAKGTGAWSSIASRCSRSAWFILSAGLASGMWWAYEDFSFGQFWHWDPVQTSVFLVWALLTASMHGLRTYEPTGSLARVLPSLHLLAAVGVVVSMMVTRNDVLASSHRYIGFTSFPLLLLLAGGLTVLTMVAYLASLKRTVARTAPGGEPTLMLRVAILMFSLIALIAAFHLTKAYVSAALDWPRPESLKPFFETLARWTHPDELERLRRVFDQQDIDGFGMNRWLTPLGALLALFGGHAFLRIKRRRLGWSITVAVALLALFVALAFHPLHTVYAGTGMTSRHTVDLFFWLDALLVTATYLAISALVWLIRMARRHPLPRFLDYFGPVGLIHTGIVVALIGAISASILDSYTQQILSYPEDYGRYQKFSDGLGLRIDIQTEGFIADGARLRDSERAFQAIADVSVQLNHDGDDKQFVEGQVLYRDDRFPDSGSRGPTRQLCQMLDYRYARFAAGPTYMLNPFIHRGLWRDLQVWVPAVGYAPTAASTRPVANARRPTDVAVVIKTYPLMTWLWIGLAIVLFASSVLTVLAWFPNLLPERPGIRPLDEP